MFTRILSESFFLVFRNLDSVFKVCGAWFCLQFVLLILVGLSLNSLAPQDIQQQGNPLFLIVFLALSLISSASIAVAWHRFALLGEHPNLIHLKVGRIEVRFIGKMLLLALIAAILFALLFGVSTLIIYLLQVPALAYVLAVIIFVLVILNLMRLNIILPATAVEHPLGLREAYDRSSGLGWRMVLAVICLTLPIGLLGAGVDYIAILSAGGEVGLGMQIKSLILNLLLQVITTVLGISVISSGFRIAMER